MVDVELNDIKLHKVIELVVRFCPILIQKQNWNWLTDIIALEFVVSSFKKILGTYVKSKPFWRLNLNWSLLYFFVFWLVHMVSRNSNFEFPGQYQIPSLSDWSEKIIWPKLGKTPHKFKQIHLGV